MKREILFVDDEQNILSGLKRMLRSLRNDYEMHFAQSGQEALELMNNHHFDLVVSDMRMPGMDGATLLIEVKERSPSTIRIVLSGEADVESICRTVGVAHQYLSKPCESKVLIRVINRACALHKILADEAMRSAIADIDSLPSLPEVYHKMQAVMKKPDVTADEVGGDHRAGYRHDCEDPATGQLVVFWSLQESGNPLSGGEAARHRHDQSAGHRPADL